MTSASTLDEALQRAAAADSLLVATDFDGVLAPFDVDPMAVRPAAGGMESLRALAALPATTVAIVSGRDLEALGALTGVAEDEPIELIGSHGAESTSTGRPIRHGGRGGEPRRREATRRARCKTSVSLVAERHPIGHGRAQGRRGRRAHPRPATGDIVDAAVTEAREVALDPSRRQGPQGQVGPELSVSHADKGSAVTAPGPRSGRDRPDGTSATT